MRFERFSASPDIVGGRVWLNWQYALGPLETPGDAPEVLLRRKIRDFEFPPLVPGDPYLVYDSAAFPPAPVPGSLQVIDLPTEETVEDGMRVVTESISVASVMGSQAIETQRRSRSIFFAPDGAPVRLRDSLLDAGSIEPLLPYYYELDDGSPQGPETIENYRTVVTPGGAYGLNRRLYAMLPESYKLLDTRPFPSAAVFSGVPETTPVNGQLRRFVDMFGMGWDALRSSAEGLRNLRDPQRVEARFLPALGDMIGWEQSNIVPIPQQRNELQTATRLFDVVGTVPALAALVTHQTGWRGQVAEFAQHVTRANLPPRRAVYVRAEQPGGGWRAADDAGPVLGFPAGTVTGIGISPATLASAVGPFALRAGMELTITVDGGVPARIRFGPDDFADISAAAAAEIAAVIARAFDTLEADAVAGAVVLRTVATGPAASLAIEAMETGILALSDAPDGPITALRDNTGCLRFVYEQRGDPTPMEYAAFDPARDDLAAPSISIPRSLRPIERHRRQVAIKSWGYGTWRPEQSMPDWAGEACSPSVTGLANGRLAFSWIDRQRPQAERLRLALAQPALAQAATILGRRAGPFLLTAGEQVTFVGAFGAQTFVVQAADYVNINAATPAEVAAAIAAQCPALVASAVAGGAVRVSTVATGDTEWLAVDLANSTTARKLGFGDRRLQGRGSWDPTLGWTAAHHGPTLWSAGEDPSLVTDPDGGIGAFWAEHRSARWAVRHAHWSERLTVVTPTGVSQQDVAGGAWVSWHIADGLPVDDVRSLAVDARGAIWFATAGGLAERRADGTWTSFTIVDGLSSNDLRDVVLLPDGSLWVATPAGISVRSTAGAISVIPASPGGLADADVRAVAADGLGNGWAAGAATVSRRAADGAWQTWTAADGLPAGPLRRLAVAPGGLVALASGNGIGLYDGLGWRGFGVADGLPSADIRAVAWGYGGTLYAATAAGLAIWNGRRWSSRTPADGLPAADLRSTAVLADGRLAIGTATGLMVGEADAPTSQWLLYTTADGLAGPTVVGVHGGWSSPITLADTGGGNREPRATVHATGVTWLFWAQRAELASAPRDSWTIRLRRYDPATGSWTAEQAITTPPATGASDREPAVEPDGAGFRVFFSSDRAGGRALWSVAVDGAGIAGVPAQITSGGAESSRPVAVTGPDGATWLACRSDAPVALAQVAMIPPPGEARRISERVPEARALSLNAGARSPVMKHAARNLGRRLWGDYFTYTPERPNFINTEAPTQTHVYTRRTIGLYLRQSPIGKPVTAESVARLRQLLTRYLPINLRLVLIVAPDPLVEFVYGPAQEIGEEWADQLPIVEALGAIGESWSASMPDVGVLISNDVGNLSYSAALLATLRRRTWFPDLN